LSAIALLEIAVLFGEGSTRLKVPAQELLAALGPGVRFHNVPIDAEIAVEAAAIVEAKLAPVFE
jgi:PIN domain nuclease of toxin-antitoxin system